MKQSYHLNTILVALFVSASSIIYAQSTMNFWTRVDATKAKELSQKTISPTEELFFQLDIKSLKSALSNNNTVITFPNSKGELNRYKVFETSVMSPELQAQYPNTRSYTGQGIDNPSEVIKFSITPKGFHGMFLGTSEGTQLINPLSSSKGLYSIFTKKKIKASDLEWRCGVQDSSNADKTLHETNLQGVIDDGMFRNYRIAIACTGEYADYHGGTVSDVVAAMSITMTRINGIFERDLSVTMTMVDNTSIIYLDASTDPFTNDSANTLLGESQTVINDNIGAANYDIGHTFSTSAGGVAGLGVTCNDSSKAKGVTGLPTPEGDQFDVEFVAHELGHQFGAPHTFNGNQGNCSARSASNAYEPGSGTTIMAYAGFCGSDNIQANGDAYFHHASISIMSSHITNTGACPTDSNSSGNAAPTANAGGDYTIPIGTPYKLLGSSTDSDGTASHTFTWEQYDLGPAGVPTETTATGPLVRSFEGTNNPTRHIPRLEDLLESSGGSTDWEKLATINRDLNFKLTVRDNDARGGQIGFDDMTATVTNTAGPFLVTSQNVEGQSWDVGSTQTITWDVAGTTANGINETNVNILFSEDGVNYDTVLAANVPNDGSHDITAPSGIVSTTCRVMVEAVNNIFFNINTENIEIGAITVCESYSTGAINSSTSDFVIREVPITISDSGTINDNIKINIDITHTNLGHFDIQLTSPGGRTILLWGKGCSGSSGLDVTFIDGESSIVCASPTTGTYSPPNQSLSTFNGQNINGRWELLFVDLASGSTGTIHSWSLEYCVSQTLSIEENEIDNITIYPNPNDGTFNIKFTPNSGENIKIELFDLNGRSIYSKTYETSSTFDKMLQLNDLQSGLYLIQISEGSNRVTKKIIVN